MPALRDQIPALAQTVHGRPLIYLDNAATTLQPRAVLDAVAGVAGNVHRASHALSVDATTRYEATRDQVAHFLNARDRSEIIFTSGTTASLNLVAQSFGPLRLKPGDEVLVSQLEHHANLLPWQQLCKARGARLVPIPITNEGIDLDAYRALLTSRTRLVAVAHVSNVLGSIAPIAEMAELAHAHGAAIIVDGAQAVAHLPVDVTALDCDFYAFSAHKLYGPTGAGVLYAKREHLDAMPPWQTGGHIVRTVTFAETTYLEPPMRFEPGTPPIAAVIGLGAALTWLATQTQTHEPLDALEALRTIPGLHLLGPPARIPVFAFTLDGIHPHDLATIIDQDGVAIRAGHHCAQPLHEALGLRATARASFGIYNTRADLQALVDSISKARQSLRK